MTTSVKKSTRKVLTRDGRVISGTANSIANGGSGVVKATPGSVASISPYEVPTTQLDADKAQQNLLALNQGDANQTVNSNQEYRTALKNYQGQIDATNAVYADQLNQSRIAGQGALGTNRASQARGGLLGSDFGEAQTSNINSANQSANQSIQNRQNTDLNSIYGMARADAEAQVTAKTLAKRSGAEAVAKYYTETAPAARKAKVSTVAKALFDKNIDPATLTPQQKKQLADSWGVSMDDIESVYSTSRTEREAEAAKQAREIAKEQSGIDKTTADIAKINADIASGKLITIGEGNKLYNTETGEVVAYNPKTYAPKETSGTGSTGGEYGNDLDAIIGATLSSIPSKFGQSTFQSQINKSRNDGDKINLIATTVLKGQPAELKADFSNQAIGIKEIDKAIAELDSGVKTGFIEDKVQYAANFFGKDYDPKLAKINAHLTAAIQPYRNSVTGAAWGTQEDSEYASLFGSTKYSPAELKQRLVNVKEVLKSKSASGLNTFVNPMGYYDNQFEAGNYAPTADLTNVSDAELEALANQ